jgi:hypothetical protein
VGKQQPKQHEEGLAHQFLSHCSSKSWVAKNVAM